MAKEFDIYLNRRIRECDIIVQNLMYRDSLSVSDRIVLESCIESYTLRKIVAMQTGSALTAHINEMLKTCYELIGAGASVGANVGITAHTFNSAEPSRIVIDADILAHSIRAFNDAENGLQLSLAPIASHAIKSAGIIMPIAAVGAEMDTAKAGYINGETGLRILAELNEAKLAFIETNTGVAPAVEIADLLYRVSGTAEMALSITAQLIDLGVKYPFAPVSFPFCIDIDPMAETVRKLESAENAVAVMAELCEKLIRYLDPEESTVRIGFDAQPTFRRLRRLYELDDRTLAGMDGKTLEELDYITLD